MRVVSFRICEYTDQGSSYGVVVPFTGALPFAEAEAIEMGE